MNTTQATRHYGTYTALADALGFRSVSTITNWNRRYGGQIPELYARRLHELTRGRLKFDRKEYGL